MGVVPRQLSRPGRGRSADPRCPEHRRAVTGRAPGPLRTGRGGEPADVRGAGNGPLAAFADALAAAGHRVDITAYAEHATATGPDSAAVAYVRCRIGRDTYWGAGQDTSVRTASVRAVPAAVNRAARRWRPRIRPAARRSAAPAGGRATPPHNGRKSPLACNHWVNRSVSVTPDGGISVECGPPIRPRSATASPASTPGERPCARTRGMGPGPGTSGAEAAFRGRWAGRLKRPNLVVPRPQPRRFLRAWAAHRSSGWSHRPPGQRRTGRAASLAGC
ncbi:alpha-isopropylmalate synthase regulatory domain-containing protein [Streptomyces sp. BHT-5-2]|uniref:alpha-isopropylmalate synthase regulatory domain-containing protein n=1 Tax=Streptomyces sp. BHT-5-2 TaxID=2866715 RepID=UPI0037D99968